MIGKSGDLKFFVGLFLSWVVMQRVAVAEGSEIPTSEVARGRSWGLRWDRGDVNPLLVSACDCFRDCDTEKKQLTKDEQRQLPPWYPRGIPHPNPSDIPSPTLVLLTKTFLCHYFLRDFVSALYAIVGNGHFPHLRLRAPGFGFPKHRFRITNAMRASSLASPVCPWWSR